MKPELVSHRFTIPVIYYRTVPADDGRGTRTDVDRTADETVEVTVDFAGLARQLGPRACRSRGGKAVDVGGLVVVRPVRRKGADP